MVVNMDEVGEKIDGQQEYLKNIYIYQRRQYACDSSF